jgi:hypothetical protein
MPLTVSTTARKLLPASQPVTTAGINATAAPSITLAGTADTNQISDDAVTAAKAEFGAWHWASTGGTANAITLTTGNSLSGTPATGEVVAFQAGANNTGAVDVTIDSYAAGNVYKHGGTELVADDIRSGAIYELRFDGSNWQIMGTLGRREIIIGVDDNSGDNYEFTPDPGVTAPHANKDIVFLKCNTANTGAASLGGVAIKKQKDQDLSSGDIKAGQWVVLVHDGTYWQMVSPVSNSQAPGIPGNNAGLVIVPNTGTPASELDVNADFISLSTDAGEAITLVGVDLTGDLTTGTAQNGVDTGSGASSATGYWIYVCYDQNAGGNPFLLFSTNATKPSTGVSYTHYAKVGWVYYDATPEIAQYASYRQGLWYFVSAELTGDASAAATFTVSHPFGRKPQRFHATAVCVSADLGFAVGDEVLAAVIADASLRYTALQLYVNTTNLVLRQGYPVLGSGAGLAMLPTTGVPDYLGNDGSGPPAVSDWNWKLYAEF